MIALFNADMGRRLADLHVALSSGVQPTIERHEAFQRLPDRCLVKFGERVVTFSTEMAGRVAAQCEANGFERFAADLRVVAR